MKSEIPRRDQPREGHSYSSRWFAVFLDTIPHQQTGHEAAFVAGRLPLPRYRRLVDLCCGSGRHARALATLGYDVTGIDVSAAAMARARQRGGAVRYVRADMRWLPIAGGSAEAIICLWQSFGHLDAAGNADVLRQMAEVVDPGGRVLLDVYNRQFFESRTGVRILARGGEEVTEASRLADRRLTVDLRYGDGRRERFEWLLYTARELETLANDVGLRLVESAAAFDETLEPGPHHARMQLVFERTAARHGR